MPRVTQYIREEDMEAWNAIKNKSLWIHNHLTRPDTLFKGASGPIKPIKEKELLEVVKTMSSSTLRSPSGFCKKHGTPLDMNGRCLQKGH